MNQDWGGPHSVLLVFMLCGAGSMCICFFLCYTRCLYRCGPLEVHTHTPEEDV